MNFSKMEGLGNDFVLVNEIDTACEDYSKLAEDICHRNFGIGADGLIVVKQSTKADIRMKHYNADGSEAAMCGNGIRCFSKFIYQKGLITSTSFKVETLGGIMEPMLNIKNGVVETVKVNMGTPDFLPSSLPALVEGVEFINQAIDTTHGTYNISLVKIGASHGVIFTEELTDDLVNTVGRELESHRLFPNRININFAKILSNDTIKIKTWERGAGRTLACGTGACSSVVIGAKEFGLSNKCRVILDGGQLNIEWDDKGIVFMEGAATFICDGFYYIK